MAAKCLALAGALLAIIGLCSADDGTGHFMNLRESDEISINKLLRLLAKDDSTGDEASVAERVGADLARTIDKFKPEVIASKYSVADLLYLNTYRKNYLHYCSKGEIEARQEQCRYLADNSFSSLSTYCFHCAAMHYDICQENIPRILTDNILSKERVNALMLKNIKNFVHKFQTYVRMDGDEEQSDEFNFKEFLTANEDNVKGWEVIKGTCERVVNDFSEISYFDEEAKLSFDYLEKQLSGKQKERAVLGYCGPFIGALSTS